MTLRRLLTPVIIITGMVLIIMAGCSDKIFNHSETVIPANASPSVYIPMEQGWRINYALLEPSTEYFSVEVTDSVSIAGNPGVTVRHINSSTGEITYSYCYEKGNAVFESWSTDNPGVRILESPFVIGHSWDRMDTSTTTTTFPYDSNTTDGGGVIDWKDYFETNGFFLKIIPGEAYNTMSFIGHETVIGLNGVEYGQCLKVAWPLDSLACNYYWYAAGIGLVKFQNTSDRISATDNTFTYLLTDYQKVTY